MLQTFVGSCETFSGDDLPYAVRTSSDDFFDAWRSEADVTDVFGRQVKLGGDFSFCFIDGNHSYDFAKRDFENCDACLVPGGFILFDDSADGSLWDVCDVVREVRTSDRYELVMRNPNYLFRKLT